MVKNQPANARDARDAGSILGREDPLEEGRATHSSILARRMPWTEEPGGLQSMGSQTVRHYSSNFTHTYACLPYQNSDSISVSLVKIYISERLLLFFFFFLTVLLWGFGIYALEIYGSCYFE